MSEELLTVFYCCDWWMDVSKISTVIPWWGRLLPQAHAGHSANHRRHRSSSWKCLANPDATGRNGLWWTWHLFISSIFGTKCWSWISSTSFKVRDTSSTADNSWHHCCSRVTSTFSMSHLVHPTSSCTSCAVFGPTRAQHCAVCPKCFWHSPSSIIPAGVLRLWRAGL